MAVLTRSFFYYRVLFPVFCVLTSCISPALAQQNAEVYPVGYGYYNAYLVKFKGQALLVDTGIHGKEKRLEKNIKKAGVNPEDITCIVLTHAHGDHVGGAARFQERYDTPVILHKGGLVAATRGTIYPLRIGTPRVKLAKFIRKRTHRHFPAFSPNIIMQEDTMHLQEYGFEGASLIAVGGHSAGSLIVSFGNIVFAGDLLRGSLVPGFRKKPAYHFFADEKAEVYDRILKLLEQDYDVWYVGHGGPLGTSKIRDYVLDHPLVPRTGKVRKKEITDE